jgi:periodic tryptophan protein 2
VSIVVYFLTRYFAATVGMQMQVWFAPGHTKDFSPFTLHRTYTGQYDDTVSVDWSSDSRYIVGSWSCYVISEGRYFDGKPLVLSGVMLPYSITIVFQTDHLLQ